MVSFDLANCSADRLHHGGVLRRSAAESAERLDGPFGVGERHENESG
jgi:hypothetical protein